MKKEELERLREEYEHGKTLRKLSPDFIEFLKSEVERKSFYEKFCMFSRKIIKIQVGDEKTSELKQKLDFCNLNIEPSHVYSGFIFILLATILLSIAATGILYLLYFDTASIIKYILLISITGFSLAYYVFIYPSLLAKKVRVEASAEIVQAILYMAIGLRHIPNLESAVTFASVNLSGPMGRDLRKLLWDIYNGRYNKIEDALDNFSMKWKFENKEFSQAIDLLKISTLETTERDKIIDRAVTLILQSNMERMNEYARELKNPITIINGLGILLPVITLLIFPILGLIMPTLVKPYVLVIAYNILLPALVFWFMKNTLDKRPYGFHVTDISEHPEASKIGNVSFMFNNNRIQVPLLPFAIVIFSVISLPAIIGMFEITSETALTTRLLYGLQIFWGMTIAIIFYTIFSTNKNKKIKKEIEEIESEFGEAMFMLSSNMRRGQPLEMSLRKTSERLKDQKIYGLFQKIIDTMNLLGTTFKDAVFNEKYGVIKYYPSRIIKNTLKIVSESSTKGFSVTASTLTAISQYLKNVHEVDEHLKELLEEVTSSMQLMSSILVPLTAGVIVGLSSIVIRIIMFVASLFAQLPIEESGKLPIFGSNLQSMMPIEAMLLVVGFYMVELLISLNIFRIQIERGSDTIEMGYSIGTNLISGAIIFTISVIIIHFGLGALIPLGV